MKETKYVSDMNPDSGGVGWYSHVWLAAWIWRHIGTLSIANHSERVTRLRGVLAEIVGLAITGF